ncbi:MAG: polysaccharide deacetylase family protein [Holophaga sp.]|nr:polysaccharide deacetylase family protein [Holophaga sp.]
MRAGAGLYLLVALGSLSLIHCDREKPPAEVRKAPAPHTLEPWRWHTVGGLLVVEGELEQPTELTLKGRFISETCRVPLGPVRWELYRPPPGEVAELRSANGKLLARWNFDVPPGPVELAVEPEPKPAPPKAAQAPAVAKVDLPRPVPPPAPARVIPPGPWARIEPHLPLPRPVQAPAVAKVEPPRPPAPAVPARVVPRGPWARIEPHLPLPKPVQAPAVAKAEPPKPVAPPPARPSPAPVPRPAPSLPPVAKGQPVSRIPAGLPERAALHPIPPVPPLPVLPATPAKPLPVVADRAPATPPATPPTGAAGAQDWPGMGEGLNLLRGPRGERRICMTFDGGSTAEVAVDILDALHEHGIRTTLFLTGDFIKKYPNLVLRMVKEGHELGNHTMTHPHMAPRMKRDPRWTKERVQKELLDADRAFYRLTGRPMDPYWRSPFGENTAEIRRWAEELGYRHVDWSEGADTLDWTTVKEYNLYRNGTATIERLERRMKKTDGDGLIVLMHLGSMRPALDRPARYLGPFMDRAIQQGWHFVCVGDYLKSMGKPRWDAARRLARLQQGAD